MFLFILHSIPPTFNLRLLYKESPQGVISHIKHHILFLFHYSEALNYGHTFADTDQYVFAKLELKIKQVDLINISNSKDIESDLHNDRQGREDRKGGLNKNYATN